MDKSRDAKSRGATRFKQSKPKLSSGLMSSEAKREKRLRKLSSVERSSCEMENLGTTNRDEDEPPSFGRNNTNNTKRIKLSEKFFDDCNGVGHASVPRRLRSAMKKRSRDSVSPTLPYSKKVKAHMQDVTNSTKMDGIKKSKSNTKQGRSDRCSKRILSGPITKDEEEVAATLFALAGLFSDDNKANCEAKGNNESLEPNGSHRPALEVAKKHGRSVCALMKNNETAVLSSDAEKLPQTVKVESWNETNVQGGSNLQHSEKFHSQLDDSVSRVSLHSSLTKIEEHCDEKPLCGSAKICVTSDLQSDARLRHALQQKTSFLERKPETTWEMATTIWNQTEAQCKLDETKKRGLALWPSLPSTTLSKAAQAEDSSLPSSCSKLPGWLDAACSGSRRGCSIQNKSIAKMFKVTHDGRASKRCVTHVYISRLIQSLRNSDAEDRSFLLQGQIRPHEGLNQGVAPSTIDGFVSISSINSTIAKQHSTVAMNGFLQQRSHHDLSQSAEAPALSNWPQQSFDLSTSLARGDGNSGRARNGLESSPSSLSPLLQNPYLQSFPQNQLGASFPIPQPCNNSSARSNHFPTAQQIQMQLTSYNARPCYGVQTSPTVLAKLLHQHQQQQRQLQHEAQLRLWGAHYISDNTPAPKPTIQFLDLQNDPQKQQQQQPHQIPISVSPSPFSPDKVMRQDLRLPSTYKELGGGFHTNPPLLPLQLLCNERL